MSLIILDVYSYEDIIRDLRHFFAHFFFLAYPDNKEYQNKVNAVDTGLDDRLKQVYVKSTGVVS